jgi:sortase A
MSKHSGRMTRIIARVLIFIGLAMMAYFYGTGLYTGVVQDRLNGQWQRQQEEKSASHGKETAPDMENIFGRLIIPRMNLDVIVLEGTDRATLMKGPGHIKGTAKPSDTMGNTVISGHRTTFGAPFADLDQLQNGDRVILNTRDGRFVYQVSGARSVKPTDLTVIGQNYDGRLTLTTCDPPGSAVRRLAVWGIKKPAP